MTKVSLRASLTVGADLALSHGSPAQVLETLSRKLPIAELWEMVEKWLSQRHLVFLKDPSGEGRSLSSLNKTIEGVFGAALPPEELQQLFTMKGIEDP